MEIQIHQSYINALAELATAEQKRIGKLIEKIKLDPTAKGLNIEQISNGFISIRANQDIRVIGQQVGDVIILHYIDHHEEAYDWANKRKRLAELTGGGYRLVADSITEEQIPTEASSVPLQNSSNYGKSIFDKLAGLGFPMNVARTLETVQSEDDLLERIEELPQNTLYMVLDAIYNDIPYKAHLSNETIPSANEIILTPQEVSTEKTLPTAANVHKEAKLTATANEASTTDDADGQRHLLGQQNQSQHGPSDTPLTYMSEQVEAELKRLKQIVSSTAPPPDPIIARPTFIRSTRQPEVPDDIEEANITDSVVLLRIDRSHRSGITAQELYEATRGDWVMTPDKRLIKPRYAMAIVSFVIREVYMIDDWHPVPASPHGPSRWQFDGTVALDKANFIGKSVQNYINRRSSNPVRYVNCD